MLTTLDNKVVHLLNDYIRKLEWFRDGYECQGNLELSKNVTNKIKEIHDIIDEINKQEQSC